MTYLPGPNFTSCGSQNLHFMGPKKYIVCLISFNRGWFELRKTPHRVPVSLIPFKISFFSKNNSFRAKMYGILKIDLFIRYNCCTEYFFPRSIFIDIKWKNLLKTFFFKFLILKINFASILIIIIVISASEYINIVSFKLIGGKSFSEVHP